MNLRVRKWLRLRWSTKAVGSWLITSYSYHHVTRTHTSFPERCVSIFISLYLNVLLLAYCRSRADKNRSFTEKTALNRQFVYWGTVFAIWTCQAFAQAIPESLAVPNTMVLLVARFGAEGSDIKAKNSERQNTVGNFLEDEKEIWTSPLRMDWDEAALWGGVAVTTALLVSVDEPVLGDFLRYQSSHSWVRKASPIATQFGQFYVPYGIVALYCLKGAAFDDDRTL